MITLLAKRFIPNSEHYAEEAVRNAYGTLCGIVGIVLNLILFAGKYFAGMLAGSIAVMADAFNNLADAGSSIITLLGFRLAAKKPDPDHPFGHGRMEYMSGLVVSVMIIIVGYQLAVDSYHQIMHPEAVDGSLLTLGILVVSIAIKLYIYAYNKSIGKKIKSPGMTATAMDSLTDSISTLVVLVSMVLAYCFDINVDGICGILVAGFILYTGIKSTKETMDPLLGAPPEPEFVEKVINIVMSYDEILNVHDLMVHDYGPGRCIVSLHAEVPGDGNIFALHDAVDRAEMELSEKLGCTAVIHLDPVSVNDEKLTQMRGVLSGFVNQLGEGISIHDFRIVEGPTHTNMIFDALLPYDSEFSPEQLEHLLSDFVKMTWEHTNPIIHIDRPFA